MIKLTADAELQEIIHRLQAVRQELRKQSSDLSAIRHEVFHAVNTAHKLYDALLLTPEHELNPQED